MLGQSRRSVAETYSDRTITHTEEGEAEGGGGGEGAVYPAVLRLASLMRQLTGTSEADGGGGRGRSVPPAVALVRSGTAPEMEMC